MKTQEGSAVDMAILEFVNRSLSSSTAAEVGILEEEEEEEKGEG